MSDSPYTHFIAVGNNSGWGRDVTEKKAIRNMHSAGREKATAYYVYQATADTYVNEMGGLSRPAKDAEPKRIRTVGL